MTLAKTGLGNVTSIAASANADVYTAAGGKNAYISALLIHNTGTSSSQDVNIYFVPNGSSAATANEIGNMTLTAKDTAFFELAYPLTMTTNGDAINVANGSGNVTNVLVLGDVES